MKSVFRGFKKAMEGIYTIAMSLMEIISHYYCYLDIYVNCFANAFRKHVLRLQCFADCFEGIEISVCICVVIVIIIVMLEIQIACWLENVRGHFLYLGLICIVKSKQILRYLGLSITNLDLIFLL